jgi:hypothetical protein
MPYQKDNQGFREKYLRPLPIGAALTISTLGPINFGGHVCRSDDRLGSEIADSQCGLCFAKCSWSGLVGESRAEKKVGGHQSVVGREPMLLNEAPFVQCRGWLILSREDSQRHER